MFQVDGRSLKKPWGPRMWGWSKLGGVSRDAAEILSFDVKTSLPTHQKDNLELPKCTNREPLQLHLTTSAPTMHDWGLTASVLVPSERGLSFAFLSPCIRASVQIYDKFLLF
jgi:hypothetical protein